MSAADVRPDERGELTDSGHGSRTTLNWVLALLTMERDVQDEWQFAKGDRRERIKFTPSLTAYGEELREAALVGCGIVRLLECHVQDEMRSGALVRLLPDWECLGGLPIVAIYRKQRPTLSRVSAFVRHLSETFQRNDRGRPQS